MNASKRPPNEVLNIVDGVATVATYGPKNVRRPEVFLIDEADLDILGGHRWSLLNSTYIHRTYGSKKTGRKSHILHRLIALPGDGLYVDHINGNGLDNRRSNLRVVTPQQNQWNTDMSGRPSSTGRRGVQRYGEDGFRANISVTFSSMEEAVAQRAAWEAALHGEYRRSAS